MTKRTVTMCSDPAHGWLRVNTKDIADLGIGEKVSAYSYLSSGGRITYLEEDSDATLYMKEAEKRGWEIEVKYKEHRGRSFIRNLPSYDANWFKDKYMPWYLKSVSHA